MLAALTGIYPSLNTLHTLAVEGKSSMDMNWPATSKQTTCTATNSQKSLSGHQFQGGDSYITGDSS